MEVKFMVMSGAEPFFFPGNKKGVLLVHGYTGTPAEMRELGERLNKDGYTTMGILLPGHGTKPEDMKAVTWEDWYASVEKAFRRLSENCSEISIMGMSMGSLLALVAGSKLPVKNIVLMSTPVYLFDWRVHFMWILKYFMTYTKKRIRIIDAEERFNVSYDCLPVVGVEQVLSLMQYCMTKVIPSVQVPCLIMQSEIDHTVRPNSARFIYDNISSEIKKLVWFEHSKHVLTLYEERDKVYETIKAFLKE
jgi:carboxylesterase